MEVFLPCIIVTDLPDDTERFFILAIFDWPDIPHSGSPVAVSAICLQLTSKGVLPALA